MYPRVPQSETPTPIIPSFVPRHRRSFCTLVDAALHSGGENPEISETWKGKTRAEEFRKKLKVVDINGGPDEGLKRLGQTLVVTGWVRNFRVQSSLTLIEVNDGSCLSNMVCVLGSDAEGCDQVESGSITIGASIWVQGVIATSQASKQKVELKVKKMVVIGKSDPSYPIQNKRASGEILRTKAHTFRVERQFSSSSEPSKPKLVHQHVDQTFSILIKGGFISIDFKSDVREHAIVIEKCFYKYNGHQMTLAELINSTDPAVLAIKKQVFMDLIEKVASRIHIGVLYGNLDPSLIDVVDLKVNLPPGFSRGPRHFSYIQQTRKLLLQSFNGTHNESKFKSLEREHFISHVLDLNNVLELVCLVFHPYLLSDHSTVMFVVNAVLTLEYGGNKFPNLLSKAGKCNWKQSFDAMHFGDVNLEDSIADIQDVAMRKRFVDIFNFGESNYTNDYSCALVFYQNVIKHFEPNLGVPLLILREMFPCIPVDTWSCLTSNFVYYMGTRLNMNCFTNYWHLSYPITREILSSHLSVDRGGQYELFIDCLAPHTQVQGLRERFQLFGKVMNVDIILLRDTRTGTSCQFKRALVSYSDFEEACIAVEAMHGQELDGSRISVEHALDVHLEVYCGESFGDVTFMANEQDDVLFQSFVPGRAVLRRMFNRYRMRESASFIELN